MSFRLCSGPSERASVVAGTTPDTPAEAGMRTRGYGSALILAPGICTEQGARGTKTGGSSPLGYRFRPVTL
ncbi:hypothetical protein GCM10009748_07340 [Agromyces lapidis]